MNLRPYFELEIKEKCKIEIDSYLWKNSNLVYRSYLQKIDDLLIY